MDTSVKSYTVATMLIKILRIAFGVIRTARLLRKIYAHAKIMFPDCKMFPDEQDKLRMRNNVVISIRIDYI